MKLSSDELWTLAIVGAGVVIALYFVDKLFSTAGGFWSYLATFLSGAAAYWWVLTP